LDVGCAESLLSHELVARGFRVIGLDIRDYPFKNRRVIFVRRNVLDTGFPDGMFDAILVVSTIEHIGLSTYGQLALDDEGDLKAMKELYRILKPRGIIITTPYIGNCPLRVDSFERNYNRQRLQKLIEGFKIVRKDYFYPRRIEGKVCWERMSREDIDQESFVEAGLACQYWRRKLILSLIKITRASLFCIMLFPYFLTLALLCL
jgi:SAM-dependent methyltransferase